MRCLFFYEIEKKQVEILINTQEVFSLNFFTVIVGFFGRQNYVQKGSLGVVNKWFLFFCCVVYCLLILGEVKGLFMFEVEFDCDVGSFMRRVLLYL